MDIITCENCQKIFKSSVLYRQIDIMKKAIEMGADIHLHSEEALQNACIFGYFNIVKFLIGLDADAKVCDDLPIKIACELDHLKIVKLLSEQYNGFSNSTYMDMIRFSIINGNLKLVKFLFGKNINNIQHKLLVPVVFYYNQYHILHYFIQQGFVDVSVFSLFETYKYNNYISKSSKKIYFWWVQICYNPTNLCGQRIMKKKYMEYIKIQSLQPLPNNLL